ncbi:MAG: phosphoheptose isomerase [Desulfobulbaceae bacterium A2]|nr:MAG: phosphoheptose isomerase [Desulfobulbaceae bacterium A2]
MQEMVARSLARSLEATESFAREGAETLVQLAALVIDAMRADNKLLIFGNGGSAADAQHVAAEFVNRFLINRRPLPALALTTDSSVLTSIGNDFSYELVFVKQVQALGRPGDVALGISTSGTSPNVVQALAVARAQGLRTAALIGGLRQPTADLQAAAELILRVPSAHTPHIQEAHLWAEHLLCEMVEEALCGTP